MKWSCLTPFLAHAGDRHEPFLAPVSLHDGSGSAKRIMGCLLYTSDAADERSSVDLGGRRIIKKKTNIKLFGESVITKQTHRNYRVQKRTTENL